jgi:hypothetical protein
LPAPPHEPPTRGGRLLIVATAAIGLALVGVMAIRMTPGENARRDALVTVSTSAVFPTFSADSVGELAEAASNGGRRFTDLLGRTLSAFLSSTDRSQVSASTISLSSSDTSRVDSATFAVVTPIGTDGLGVTTAAAVEGRSGTIEAMLPSGAIVTAELVGTDNGVAVVNLSDTDSTGATRLAGTEHADDWTVVAYGDEFEVSEDRDGLRALTVPEAAPIFDASGALVGLCTIGPDGVEMLPVESLPDIEPPLSATQSTETTETAQSTETTDTTETTEAALTTEPVDGGNPAVGALPAAPPASSPGTLPASTDVVTTDGSAVPTSEPVDSSEPATTAGL